MKIWRRSILNRPKVFIDGEDINVDELTLKYVKGKGWTYAFEKDGKTHQFIPKEDNYISTEICEIAPRERY